MKSSLLLISLVTALLVGAATPQTASSPGGAPVSLASVTEISGILADLNQASQTLNGDLSKLRVEKWKTDGDTKRQSLANVESVQRNIQNALPAMVTQLSGSPDSLTATFKLYRNIGALYDVLSNLAESAGAFGSRDELQTLTNDASGVEKIRRALAERMDKLTASKEAELASLHTQVRAMQAAMPPPPPTRIIVDDAEKPKKPVKKKIAKPATAPATPAKTP